MTMAVNRHMIHLSCLFSQHLVELLGLREMSIEFHKAATYYVLQNCDEALPFVQEHKNILIQSSVGKVEESHRLQFSNWISKRVTKLYNDGKVSKQMLSLARGPER
ncbi:unnamed protein product [Prunus armeniaca]